MSAISTILTRLADTVALVRSAIFAIDVRDDIADAIEKCGEAIEQCYSDVSNPTLQTEALEAALQTKIDEGEMAALTIGDGTITAAKLASGVIDNTLITAGAAADAKKTGDEIAAVKADLGYLETDMPGVQEKSFYTTRASASGTTQGIAYVFDHTTYTVTESGTATGNAFVNIVGSNSVIPSVLNKGRKYKLAFSSTDENILMQVAVKDSGGNTLSGGISGVSPIEFEIPQNAYGVIARTLVYKGTTVDGAISNFHFEGAISESLKPSGDTSDRTAEILKVLNNIGSCRLESGVYYVSGLVMPEGTDLKGAGKSTVIRLIDSDESEEVYAVKMGRHCTVSDLSIIGADSDIALPTDEGKRVGILYAADDNSGVATTTVRGNVKGVYISRMTGSGIKCHNTGYSSSGNCNWSNLWIWNCYNGINIDYFSEYHHFSCFNVSFCKWAIVNNGGNNIFSCGAITTNENGFKLDNSAGDKPNNGHGSCVGLNINHNGGVSGQSVYINDCGSGFLFLGCHISQGEIALTKVAGVIFSACHFGSDARVTIKNGWGILFEGCTSSGTTAEPNPTVTVINNRRTRFVDCFYKGGVLWDVCDKPTSEIQKVVTSKEALTVTASQTGVYYGADYIDTLTLKTSTTWIITNLIDMTDYDKIEYSGITDAWTSAYSVWFDENEHPIALSNLTAAGDVITKPRGAVYLSLSLKNRDVSLALNGLVMEDITSVVERLIM